MTRLHSNNHKITKYSAFCLCRVARETNSFAHLSSESKAACSSRAYLISVSGCHFRGIILLSLSLLLPHIV